MQSRGFASVNTLSDPEPQQRTPDVRVTQDGTSSVTFNLTLLLACFGLDRVVSGAGVALCKDELSCDGTSEVGSSVFTFFYLHFGLLSMSIFQNVSLSPYPSLCLSFHFFYSLSLLMRHQLQQFHGNVSIVRPCSVSLSLKAKSLSGSLFSVSLSAKQTYNVSAGRTGALLDLPKCPAVSLCLKLAALP